MHWAKHSDFVTVRKRSLRRLCFYTCLSVLRGGVRYPGPYPGGGWEVWLGASRPIPWGRLGGLAGGGGFPGPYPGGSWRVWPGGAPGPGLGGVCIPACTEADIPPADGYCCGRYASYWNAFLFSKHSHRQLFPNYLLTSTLHAWRKSGH